MEREREGEAGYRNRKHERRRERLERFAPGILLEIGNVTPASRNGGKKMLAVTPTTPHVGVGGREREDRSR